MSADWYCACPYCDAIFRLTSDKLKQRAGMVRCGACREVFDAYAHLVTRSERGFVPYESKSFLDDDSDLQARDEPVFSVPSLNIPPKNEPFSEMTENVNVRGYSLPQLDSAPSYMLKDDSEQDSELNGVRNPFEDNDPFSDTAFEDDELSGQSEPALDVLGVTDEYEIKLFENEDDFLDDDSTVSTFPSTRPDPNNPIRVPEREQQKKRSGNSESRNKYSAESTLGIDRSEVEQYINDRPNPVMGFVWTIVAAGFLILLGLQVKFNFVDQYAQHPTYRSYLSVFCKVAVCDLPPRRDLYKFTLTHTKIDLHPTQPGALRVTVKMVNEADFEQPYPALQLTLTDRVGRVVGRRTFNPDNYVGNNKSNTVGKGELVSVLFDLAHPHEKAVGFVVDIVTLPLS